MRLAAAHADGAGKTRKRARPVLRETKLATRSAAAKKAAATRARMRKARTR
jgi:hypothetical protein